MLLLKELMKYSNKKNKKDYRVDLNTMDFLIKDAIDIILKGLIGFIV